MSKKLLSTLIASLFATAPALAQSGDPLRVEGSATFGIFYNNQSANDAAKLQEYQDLNNGALSSISARGRNSTNWFEGYGENFGRSDQYMFLRGGMYGVFKAGGYLNDMPHDFSTNALTPYNGTGGNLLTATFPQLDPSTWGSFNLGYKRQDAGGYFEWQKQSPWYFRVDGNQVKFDGTKVGSSSNGTSPGNGYTALAFPTQYNTSNWGVEGGYQSGKATLSLRWDYSKFEDSNQTLRWTNPFFGPTATTTSNLLDTSYLPPDNTFNKFTLTGNYRDLPWNSVVSARYTWAKTTSNVNLAQTALNTGGVYSSTLPSENTFNGEHVNQSLALAWTASPASTVNTRVYYYWTKLQNKSDVVEYGKYPAQPLTSGLGCGQSPPAVAGTTWPPGNCENELYHYTKNNVGFDVWWRFARGQRLGAGYDYQNLDQQRFDYDKSHYNKFWAEYKNSMLDTLSARLKYQYLKRDSTSNNSSAGVGPNDPEYLLRYTSAFDLQSLTAQEIKLYLDWMPMQMLTTSFEGRWVKNQYNDVTYGRTDNDQQGYYLSVNWGDPNKLLLSGFGDWQQTKYPSNHRYIGTVSGGPPPVTNTPPGWCPLTGASANPNCYDPFAAPVFFVPTGSTSPTGSYNWSSQTKDTTWMIGAGVDWPATSQLMLKASYLYVDNNGEATFSSQNNYGNPLNIGNFDDTRQQYFNLKAIYALDKNWSFQAGYAYEKFSRNDIGSANFTYLTPAPAATAPTPPNASISYANGYYLNPNGNQNIFWLMASYKFDAPPLPAPAMKMAEAPAPAPVARPAPPPPAPAPAPSPAPAPAPQVQKITLDSKVLFDFDKAVLKPEGKAAIDSQVVGKLAQIQKLELILVTGHTDRLGSDAYNQKLSQQRADAVRGYLVSRGVDRTRIEVIGMGEKQPVVQCDQKNRKELIACLAPNRRVEVLIKGESTK